MAILRDKLLRGFRREVCSVDFYIDGLAEGIGTLLLTFYCVFIVCWFGTDTGSSRVIAGALVGAVVYGTLETLGHLQWAAINQRTKTKVLRKTTPAKEEKDLRNHRRWTSTRTLDVVTVHTAA